MSRIEQALERLRQQDRHSGGRTPAALSRDDDHGVPSATALLERFQSEGLEPPVEADLRLHAADVEVVEPLPTPLPSPPPPAVDVPPPSVSFEGAETFRGFDKSVVGKLVLNSEMRPGSVEQYRRLAAVLHQLQVERGVKKVMVASALAGEGKTLTAINLALTLSESYRRRVVLVDADLRCPRIHELLELPNENGLSEALKEGGDGRLTLPEVSARLSVLPAGTPDPDPMGALTSRRMAMILDQAAADFDWVVVDTPPVVLLPDTNLLAGMVDVAIVVVHAGSTAYDLVNRTVQALGRQRVLGVVLNLVEGVEAEYATAYRR